MKPPPQDVEVRASIDHLFRHRAGQMVATLTRVFGLEHLQAVEDAVQDAMVQALRKWPYRGMPDNPAGWLVAVARNRVLDRLRRHGSWRSKRDEIERTVAAMASGAGEAPAARFADELDDDKLRMVFACCHPAIPRDGHVALTLKTVSGFSVGEIARAFLAREPAVAQRLVRAKRRLRASGARLEVPPPEELPERLDAVLEVLYLLFNEGHTSHEGEDAVRTDLCHEAIRLVELVAGHPGIAEPRVHALAALMYLHASRLRARTDESGELLLLEEQRRSRWDPAMIARGLAHLRSSAAGRELSGYHLEAEIAACHAVAPSFEATDWGRIVECYDALLERNPSPVVALNRAVAVAQRDGPEAALAALAEIEGEPALAGYFPYWSARGELLRRAGRSDQAGAAFRRALGLTASAPARRLVIRRLNRG